MGAQQSASSADSGGTSAVSAPKTCYYELLGVSRDASDDEIKKAYRRKALELHPDRNFHDVETATRRFAEVQSAHEILSDPQERAWYDDHRDAILSGNDGADGTEPTTFRNVRLTSTEEIMSLMRKFNASIPFDDEPTGFYGIARETFEHLALEEEAAADYAGVDSPDYPTFGSSDDDYELVVKPFYSAWAGFSTMKSFSWKDKYRLTDAPDRRVRRLMEKENKKLREDASRDFNDAVRFLVTFVRKRDPRYLPNTQSDADRQQSLRDAAAKQAARSRAANNEKAASYQLPDWVQQGNAEAELFSEDDSQEAEEEVDVIECVVCDKTFKSDKQLEAHERSKKHQKAVQQLRRHLRKEGKDLNIDPVESKDSEAPGVDSNRKHDDSEASELDSANGDASPQDKADKKPDSAVTAVPGLSTPRDGSTDAENDGDTDSDYASRRTVEARLEHDLRLDDDKEVSDGGAEGALTTSTQDSGTDSAPTKKVGKARLKREKKAAAAQAQASDEHKCSKCANTFPSKTKLFNHIRDEGHAAFVPKDLNASKKKKR